MSTQIIAAIISILAIILPQFGITLPNEQLADIVQGIVVVASSVWIWYQRTTLQKAPMGAGDVNVFGKRV